MEDIKKTMDKALEFLRAEFAKLRVGRASAAMVEGVRVEVYGNTQSIKEVASIGTPDVRTITIQPWDKGVMGDIEKGILAANLGLTPMNDGKLIRISLPPLTEDRRKDFVKLIKKSGEEAKVTVRNIRRDFIDGVKKNKDLTEDASRKLQDDIQKTTDHYIQKIDRMVEGKSKEVMSL
jgi:ribosome recycling factor